MRLVENWHRVLLRSFSMWCVYLAGFLEVLPYIIPYAADYIPTWASIALLLLSPLARIIPQPSIHRSKRADNADQ